MKLSIIVPAFQAKSTISKCLDGLIRAIGPDDEIFVVDDGSTDGTDQTVAEFDDERVIVIRLDVNIGRGPARNVGAFRASGEVIVFVDADVVVHPDSLARIRQTFLNQSVTALIGSYDDRPGDPGLVSQFRNLLHHHTHQTAGTISSHFWTGLGAVRADVFRHIGGFSERRWSRNMEDVKFGHRLSDFGHTILVRPDIQGTHLRPYSFNSMIRSDLFDRAIPWTRLSLADRRTDKFVMSGSQLLAAISSCLIPVFALLALFAPLGWIGAGLASLLFGYSYRTFWARLIRLRGARFLAVAAPLSYAHTMTAVVGFVVGVSAATRDFFRHAVRNYLVSRGRRRTDDQSLSTAVLTKSENSSSEK
jgi:glycosyltransferase involved in cell wall biosynthesis